MVLDIGFDYFLANQRPRRQPVAVLSPVNNSGDEVGHKQAGNKLEDD